MEIKTLALLIFLAALLVGCQPSEEADLLRKAEKQIQFPRGSRLSYAAIPAGTTFVPGKSMTPTNAILLPEDGFAVYIDEQPTYDWVHTFQLVFVPKRTGTPKPLFHGSAFPSFAFRCSDGSTVTNWQKK
jgi:hypothetical protein